MQACYKAGRKLAVNAKRVGGNPENPLNICVKKKEQNKKTE